ncbi:MAG: type IA DNA topoisomerase [Euryarchaeota archaeon]|jgi:DNA topoisomerase-1|nr:type IA DNA topoisomerase [Euryarchaeota archaeon]MBT3757477.1 type IA DNA topoisomerase [Euryarchaeota archaeon]MBT4050569.1 type IA DNA topoisomerase [Euryarchaeota archaeon]MBT4650702.1 type IA DNA topoisomerase [Euryarchaeota archaeon]MBT4961663.1 type IA DNA topoisomerase [Euryarchaeota archaeon]
MILESGAKAKTVKKYLGKGWLVEACNGHVQDLPSKGNKDSSKAMWASKSDQLPEPPWSWTSRAEKKMTTVLKKARTSKVNEIYIATDPDREGEFIAWRLSIIFSEFETLKRVTFNEITEKSINEAIENSDVINESLVDAAKVRRFMDRLVGYRCSKFARSWKLASMGRVQTPTLGFIVDKELEREAHIPISYHSVSVNVENVKFKARFHEKNEQEAWVDGKGKHHPDRTFDLDLANNAFTALQSSGELILTSIKEGQTRRKPKPPFTTDTLLQSANSSLGWSVSKTSQLAGKLYQSGHITYIRTDSTRTNIDARNTIRTFLQSEYGQNHLGEGVVGADAKKGAANVQDAHEAIRPTRPEKIQIEGVEKDEALLYSLIWSRFAASQMSDSIRERRDLVATSEGFSNSYYGTASWRIHPGWEAVFSKFQNNVITQPPKFALAQGEKWTFTNDDENPTLTSDETKPPRRFTESSIVQEMKKAGIGRPSTYVTTINRLNSRKYVTTENSSLIPTDDGRLLWLEIVPFYNNQNDKKGLFNSDFTAKMELDLDEIERQYQTGPDVWHTFVEEFRDMHNVALEEKRKKPTKRQFEYLENRVRNMNSEQKHELLNGNNINQLSGDDMREILEKLNEEGAKWGEMPASEKQMNLIYKLADQLSLNISEIVKIAEIDDVDKLTGGKNGSASTIISELINRSNLLPATEPQVKLVRKLAEQSETPLSDLLAIADIVEISEMTKSDASLIINKSMKKRKKRTSKK